METIKETEQYIFDYMGIKDQEDSMVSNAQELLKSALEEAEKDVEQVGGCQWGHI